MAIEDARVARVRHLARRLGLRLRKRGQRFDVIDRNTPPTLDRRDMALDEIELLVGQLLDFQYSRSAEENGRQLQRIAEGTP